MLRAIHIFVNVELKVRKLHLNIRGAGGTLTAHTHRRHFISRNVQAFRLFALQRRGTSVARRKRTRVALGTTLAEGHDPSPRPRCRCYEKFWPAFLRNPNPKEDFSESGSSIPPPSKSPQRITSTRWQLRVIQASGFT